MIDFGSLLRTGFGNPVPTATQEFELSPADRRRMMLGGQSVGWDGRVQDPFVLSYSGAQAAPDPSISATNRLDELEDDWSEFEIIEEAPRARTKPASPPQADDFQRRTLTNGEATVAPFSEVDPILDDYTKTIGQMVNSGASRDEIYAFVEQYPQYNPEGLEEALNYRDQYGLGQQIPAYMDGQERAKYVNQPTVNAGQAAAVGAIDGATVGTANLIDSTLSATANSAANLIGRGDGKDWGEHFDQTYYDNRDLINAADRQQPLATNLGRFAGAIATPIPVAKWRAGAGVVKNTSRMAGEGALYGGVYGAASTDGSIADRIEAGAEGAAIGAALGTVLSPASARFARAPQRSAQREQGVEAMAAADRLNAKYNTNIQPLPGHVSHGGTTSVAQAIFEPTILGGSASGLKSASNRFADQVEQATNSVAVAAAGGTKPKTLGEAVDGALDPKRAGNLANFGEEMSQRATASYNRAKTLAGDTRLAVPRTIAQIDRILDDLREVPGGVAGQRELEELREALATGRFSDGTHTLQGLRDLRTSFGDKLDVTNRTMRRTAKQLWPTLSKDITHGLNKAGKSKAAKQYRAADRQYADDMESLAVVERILGKNGDRSTEQVIKRIISMSKDDSKRLAHIMGEMDATVAGDLRSGIIHRLGLRKSGQATDEAQFSLETFATTWGAMEEAAKTNLFSAAVRRDLDDLAKLARAERAKSQLGNPSRSGVLLENWRELGTLGRAAIGATGQAAGAALGPVGWATIAGMPISGRILASPRMARLMVRFSQTGDKSALRKGIETALQRANARRQPALVQDLLGLQQALEAPEVTTSARPQEDNWSEFDIIEEPVDAGFDDVTTATQGPDGNFYDPETGVLIEQ